MVALAAGTTLLADWMQTRSQQAMASRPMWSKTSKFIGTDRVDGYTAAGVVKMDTLTNATTLYSSGTGLMATSAQSLTTASTDHLRCQLAHRPRYPLPSSSAMMAQGLNARASPRVEDILERLQSLWHKFDQLPSNTIVAALGS